MSDPPNQEDASETTPVIPRLFCQEVVVNFTDLAGGRPEILIVYKDQRYRLRATKKGKLILNK